MYMRIPRGSRTAMLLLGIGWLGLPCKAETAAVSFPPLEYYENALQSQKDQIDEAGLALEQKGIASILENRSLDSAMEGAMQAGTIAWYDGKEYPLFATWVIRYLSSTSFKNKDGDTVKVSTDQSPDSDYALYGTTVSNLDLRHQLAFNFLSYYTQATGYVRLYIRRIVKPYLASDATIYDKVNALNVLAWTQYDTPTVRSLISPLVADPNKKIRLEADIALHMLIPQTDPPDPWDSQE